MKFITIYTLSIIIILSACSRTIEQTADYNVIPKPLAIDLNSDSKPFLLNGKTKIVFPAESGSLENNALYLKDELKNLTGLDLELSNALPPSNFIILKEEATFDNPEAYRLNVDENGITVQGGTPAGNFYGIQTLLKSIPEAEKSTVLFPAAIISDSPRFAYRGAHFDVARHFFPVDSVKSFIDMLALHNINNLHWHLTDDQGWRIEIKSRPKLTEIGSKRIDMVIDPETGKTDTVTIDGYYTQDEIKEIIDYASKRYITIIPEIDIPAHFKAALKSYPEIICAVDGTVSPDGEVSESILCAGNDSTYALLKDIFGELAILFPGKLIHIGGDETSGETWERCEVCQTKIRQLGITGDGKISKESKLQNYVMKYVADFLASKGKRVIGWDESLEGGGITDDAIVMVWRGEDQIKRGTEEGHDIILSPSAYLYFDYYQTLDKDGEPDAIGGYIPLDSVYAYNPVPDYLSGDESRRILGLQANLWTEYISTLSHAQYMELPRLAALSEVQWVKSPKDFKDFMKRMPQMINRYRAKGYNYSTHLYDISGKSTSNPETKKVTYELSSLDDSPIYFTTDGTKPTADSPVYSSPLVLDKTTVIKAMTAHGRDIRYLEDSVTFNKATWKKVELATPAYPQYSEGAPGILVDGAFGPNAVKNGYWLGFVGNNAIATIDLETAEEISRVTVRFLVVTGAWIFDTRGMKVEVSNDAKSWQTVAQEKYSPLKRDTNRIIPHTLAFTPVMAKYVRVTMDIEKSIPDWHAAKGNGTFIFIDEIVVD